MRRYAGARRRDPASRRHAAPDPAGQWIQPEDRERRMTRPWQTVDQAETDAGRLELRRRGEGDFLITLAGRVLMNSRNQRSERALRELGCAHLRASPRARVLIGGLGMGITLRSVLDRLAPDASVTVAELNPVVAEWCDGPLASLNRRALADPRVNLHRGDVSDVIREAAQQARARFDAILLDLYEGPHPGTHPHEDPCYGSLALERSRAALHRGGVLGVWGDQPDRAFEQRLRRAGFEVHRERPGRGGRRHAVTLATHREIARAAVSRERRDQGPSPDYS
jgi:spermidine synthase